MSEIVVLVSLKGQESHYESFYVPSNATVKELKSLVCKEFNSLDETKHTLYRVNYLEEPVFPLRRDNQELTKCHVSSGDQLILQSNVDVPPEDKLALNIHLTMTGQPEDSQYIEKIEVSREYTLRDLKDVILSMKQLEFAKDFVSNVNFLTFLASGTNQSERKVEKYVFRTYHQRLIRGKDIEKSSDSKLGVARCAGTGRTRVLGP
jgi:hypothetical protein